jgi:hypothetical protein
VVAKMREFLASMVSFDELGAFFLATIRKIVA